MVYFFNTLLISARWYIKLYGKLNNQGSIADGQVHA
jgi:hypothetical protein